MIPTAVLPGRDAGPSVAAPSVVRRLRSVTLVAFALGVGLSILAAWTFTDAVARQSYDRLLQSAATQIAETLAVTEGRVTASPPDAAFETLALAEGDRFFYAVRAPDGGLVTGYRALAAVPARSRGAASFANRNFRGMAVRVVTVGHVLTGANRPGVATVTVAQTLQAREAVALNLLAKVVATIVFVGGVGLVAFLAAARAALGPLRRVELQLASRPTNDLSPIEGDHPREIQALVGTINGMMMRVSERLVRLRGLTAVAAHQIRTPLAALAAQIDVLLTTTSDPEQRPRFLRLAARVEELSRLTQQLLGHAMVAYREEGEPRMPIDIVDIAREATTAGLPASLTRDIDVAFDAPAGPIRLVADRTMLHEAIRNLVDNAVAHGAPGHLTVRIARLADAVELRVCDDGPGLSPDLWPLAERPFALARQGGVGLGLSIAHAVATAHGGTLAFGHDRCGWFEVIIRLPLAPAPA